MATYCLQCSAKIGLFKKPIEGVYCSPLCRDAAAEEQARLEQQARQRGEEQARLAAQAPQPATVEVAGATAPAPAPAPQAQQLVAAAPAFTAPSRPPPAAPSESGVVARAPTGTEPCPKCGSPWNQTPGGGSFGRDRGECPWCGFSAEYIAVEPCDNCRCRSVIVVSADEARCAKCKSRPRRRRTA